MRLLAAVDLTDAPEELVARLAPWAERLGARVDLLFVDEYGASAALVMEPAAREGLLRAWDSWRVQFRARLDALLGHLPPERRGKPILLDGRPSDVITSLAGDYDLVVVGTHQRRGVSRALLGSVAERVLRLSTAPVLVMRPAEP